MSRDTMIAAFLRIPSLGSRDPVAAARKVRLAVRIAAANGQATTAEDVLTGCPAVPTYAMDRLLIRWLIARLGLWTWSWNSLVSKSDAHCKKLLLDYADAATLPEHETAIRALVKIRMRPS